MNDQDKRLIEDYLPVTELNEISAAKKKHPKHPVALIHYWPAPVGRSRPHAPRSIAPWSPHRKTRKAASRPHPSSQSSQHSRLIARSGEGTRSDKDRERRRRFSSRPRHVRGRRRDPS